MIVALPAVLAVIGCDLLHDRFLLEDPEHTVARPQRERKAVRERGQRRDRTEGPRHRKDRDERFARPDRAGFGKMRCKERHAEGADKYYKRRYRALPAREGSQSPGRPGKFIGLFRHGRSPLLTIPETECHVKTSQGIEDIPGKSTHAGTVFSALTAGAAPVPERNNEADREITGKGKAACRRMDCGQECRHDPRNDHRDRNRGNCVRVEDFEKLDVRGQDRDEIALVPPVHFRRRKLSQRLKHLVPDQRQQPERDIVVAVLLRVVEKSAEDRRRAHENEKQSHRIRPEHARQREKSASALQSHPGEDRDEDRHEKPDDAERDRQQHDRQKR